MVHMKNPAREMAYAQFGTKRFVGLQDVAIDLNRLTEPGLWAIIGTFEGSWLLLKFEKEYENPIDYQGTWNGIDPNNWISSMNQSEYESAVEGLREHISKGDVYQANICRVLATEISTEGFDIEADTTPFKHGIGKMTGMLPRWLIDEGYPEVAKALKDNLVRARLREDCDRYWRFIHKGQWHRVLLQSSLHLPEYNGLSFPEIAKLHKKDEWDCFFDILQASGPEMDDLILVGELFTEEHLAEMVSHPDFSLGVDGYTSVDKGPLSEVTMSQHPYSGHIEYLAHHVREMKTISLETAIHKMAAKPANRFGIKKRGILKEGNFADVVVFDPTNVRTRSTVQNPRAYPEGIQLVVVNGTVAVKNGDHTGSMTGKVLRRN